MGPTDEDESDSDGGGDSGGQAALTDVDEDGVDTESVSDTSVDLDPEGEPANPTEQYVFEALQDAHGEVYGSQHDVTHFIGAVSTVSHSTDADLSGTAVDPDHELWQDRPDLKDDRVISEADALRELNTAYKSLREKGLVVEDESGGPEAMWQMQVASVDDL